MLGLPTKEVKQAALHADQTLAKADRVLDAALDVLTDVKAITAAIRVTVERMTNGRGETR